MTTNYERRKKREQEEKERQEKIKFKGTAHDIFLDETTRKYYRVDVVYDIETGEAKIKKLEEMADSQPVANYKMQELFARKILGINKGE